MKFWQKEMECMSRDDIKKLQDEKLVWQVNRMYERVELFRNRMDEKGLKPSDIKGVKDLYKLPFSYKQDLRDYYPYGLFAEPLKDIVRVHASSGTTGKKIVVGYTKNDIEAWSDCFARQLYAAGADENDFIQVSYGYGLFTGGLGAHDGGSRIGATVIPTSSGNTQNQIQTMVDFGSTVLCCTPSYALYLGESIEQAGLKDKLKLKAGIFGAEPWTEEMRREIEAKLGLKAYDIYGLSEIMGPGVSYECEFQQGMHVNEDMFIPEIIDPDTGEVLPYGSKGELVFTTITKEGFPLIRYRTRDICSLNITPCKCGRTFVRMNKPTGRSDDMLIIRGVNVFPSQIEECLLRMNGAVTANYLIIVGRENNTDTLEIMAEMSDDFYNGDEEKINGLKKKVEAEIRSVLGIGAIITLVPPRTLQRSEGKAKRVIDNRKLH